MRHEDPIVAALCKLPAWRGTRTRDVAHIVPLCDEAHVEAGAVLMVQGRVARQSFLILEGQASVTIDGSEVATLGPGQFAGEMAMLDHGPRSATVRAVTAMWVLVIGPATFGALLDESAATRRMAFDLARRLRRAECVTDRDVEEVQS